jgi:hypothetical protein
MKPSQPTLRRATAYFNSHKSVTEATPCSDIDNMMAFRIFGVATATF